MLVDSPEIGSKAASATTIPYLLLISSVLVATAKASPSTILPTSYSLKVCPKSCWFNMLIDPPQDSI